MPFPARQLPEQVVGMAEGSNITASEKEAIAQAVMERRRLLTAAGEDQEEGEEEPGPGVLLVVERVSFSLSSRVVGENRVEAGQG